MESKNLIGAVMAITISIILIGSVLVSVVDGCVDEKLTYVNEGVPFVSMDDQEHTMVITNNGGVPEIVVDDVEVDQPGYLFNNQSTVIYGEDGFLRIWKYNDVTRLRIQADDRIQVNLSDGQSATVTFDATNITIGQDSAAIKPIAYLGDGEYVQMVNPAVMSDSNVLISALTYISQSEFIAIVGTGTIDDLTFKTVDLSLTDTTITVTDYSYVVEKTNLGNGLYKIDDIVLTVTFSDSSTVDLHYTYFLAPASYQYDNPSYVGAGGVAMLGAIVLLSIVAVLMIAVRAVNYR